MGCLKLALYIMVAVTVLVNQPVYIQAMSKNVPSEVIINLPSRTLEYYKDNKLIKEYPVAIGKPSTPTPLGAFKIIDKEINPSWYPPDKKGYVVSSGPSNPLGYRWMGFGGNYGIHGTNAPWEIGSVVSNGCIRMFEEDVEELFVQIQYNTPVHITYDRVKLRIDTIGQASIGIYPDVYGYENVTLGQVRHILMTQKLEKLLEDDFLSQLIAEEKGEQVSFARLYHVKINNKQLTEYLVSWGDIIYAPVIEVSANLDTAINWDEQQQLISGKQHAVPGLKKNNILYVAINHLPALFGVKQMWDTDNNCLTIHAMELLMAGDPITYNIQRIKDTHYVPIFKVAKALHRKLHWEEESQSVWLGGRKISVTMLSGEPYIAASKISDYFNVITTWDMPMQTLDMNYFSYGIDYSMYLGEMGDFVD